eukprot:jgi/Tetstr1/439240/TSEL_027682.t1
MADFTAVTSARVAAGACVRLTRQIIILCGAESWRVFPIIARGVRKVQPFFSEVLEGIQVHGITEAHLGILQDLEDVFTMLEALLSPRPQHSRVLKLLRAIDFAQQLQDVCLETSQALDSILGEDFLVPSDVLDDVASVARTLADLRLEEPLADAEAVAQMRRHMKSMQTTWQTSSVHESLRQILLEQGIVIPRTSSEIEPELNHLKKELEELQQEKREEDAFLFTHIVALYTLRQGEVCKGRSATDTQASPTSVLDDDAYMKPLYRLRPGSGDGCPAEPSAALSEARNSSDAGSEAMGSPGGRQGGSPSTLGPSHSVPILKLSRVGNGQRMLHGVRSANDILQKEASMGAVASHTAANSSVGRARSQEDLSHAAGRPALRAQSSAVSLGSSASAAAASMLNVQTFLMCPLTKEVMRDPVILVESGHTYERRAIQDDFHSARKAVLSAESSYQNPELDKIGEWVRMLASDSAVDQQIALASLVDGQLSKSDKANFLALDGVSALMKIMCFGTPSSKGFVVRVLWLHFLDQPDARLEVIRANGLPRVCELVCSDAALSDVVRETALRCLRAMAFTPPLRAEARRFGAVVKMVAIFRVKKQPVPVRKAAAAALGALMVGQPEAREQVLNANGIPVLIEQLDEFAAGRDDSLRLESLAALSQVLFNEKARRIITSRGYLKDICSLLHSEKYSFRFGVASICRLMSLETEAALEMGQLGVIPPLSQLVLKCATTSTVWPVAAAALCNMARDPMLRRIILRSGIHLERNLVGRAAPPRAEGKLANSPPSESPDGAATPEAAGGTGASTTTSHEAAVSTTIANEAAGNALLAASDEAADGSPRSEEPGKGRVGRKPLPPVMPDSPDDEWVISFRGGFAVADKPVLR